MKGEEGGGEGDEGGGGGKGGGGGGGEGITARIGCQETQVIMRGESERECFTYLCMTQRSLPADVCSNHGYTHIQDCLQ